MPMIMQGKEQPFLHPTRRLYWENDHCLEARADVIAVQDQNVACDQTCFYPGGGGQPADTGFLQLSEGSHIEVTEVHFDDRDVIWHTVDRIPLELQPGMRVRLLVNSHRRSILARYHTVLHVLNTVALRDFGAWITGVQIGEEYSRIDFKIDLFSADTRTQLERKVNKILGESRVLKSYFLTEKEFKLRKDLLRTFDAQPPVIQGRVRVVEIDNFDAQACGGTHVINTSEVGEFSIFKTENKGKNNKRLYMRLANPLIQ